MNRKPFKIVTDLDLSGNKLIDVSEIYRRDYNLDTLGITPLDLTIRAGGDEDVNTAPELPGGSLNLYSGVGGSGASPVLGAINAFVGGVNYSANKWGLEIKGNTEVNVKTNSQDINLIAGTTNKVVLTSTLEASGTTGSLQVAGGTYIAKKLFIDGEGIYSNRTTSFDLLNTNITTINAFGAANNISIGKSTTVVSLKGSASDSSVIMDGGLYVKKNLKVDGNTILGDTDADSTTIYGNVILANNSSSDTLRLGADVNLYRSASNVLTLDDDFIVKGNGTTADIDSVSIVNLLKSSNTINIAKAGSTTTIKGDLVIDEDVEFKGTIPYLHFEPLSSPPDENPGTLYYDANEETLDFKPSNAGVVLNIGQEAFAKIYNDYTTDIVEGTVVCQNGSSVSGYPIIVRAKADNALTSFVLGVATYDIPAKSFGYVTILGLVRDVASSFNDGPIYLSENTAGALTQTIPSEGNYVVRIGTVSGDNLYVDIGNSFTTTAKYNYLRANSLYVKDEFVLPRLSTPSSTVAGSLLYDTSGLLTLRTSSERKVIVDTNTSQDLINKTYNGLELTEQTNGFIVEGGNSKSLTLNTNLTVSGTDLTINSQGTTLNLPTGSLTINSLAANGVLYASSANVISTEPQLSVSRGGTGIASWTANRLYKGNGSNDIAVSSILDTGSAITLDSSTALNLSGILTQNYSSTSNTSSVNITHGGTKSSANTAMIVTHNSTSTTLGDKKTIEVISSGSWSGTTYGIYSNVTGGANNYSFYGANGVFRNVGESIFDSKVTLNHTDVYSGSSTKSLFNNKQVSMSMLTYEGSTLTIGNSLANQKLTVLEDSQFGSSSSEKHVDIYGDVRMGGPTGFMLDWNATDSSLDFIKL